MHVTKITRSQSQSVTQLPVPKRGFLREGGGNFRRTSTGDDENVYACFTLEYKYRVEAECGLYGYDKENFMDNLAMNVARFASSVAKVMDVIQGRRFSN